MENENGKITKSFIEMYNEGWCTSCKELDSGWCSKNGLCKAYEDVWETGKTVRLIKIDDIKKEGDEDGKKSI